MAEVGMVFGKAEGAANIRTDIGQPDNVVQKPFRPCLARRTGHCVVARSLRIQVGYARRSRVALPGTALPPFLESIFGTHSIPFFRCQSFPRARNGFPSAPSHATTRRGKCL